MKTYGKIRLVFSNFNSKIIQKINFRRKVKISQKYKFLPFLSVIDYTFRIKVLKNITEPHNIVIKSKMSFSQNKKNFVIVLLQMNLSIFMQLTAERDNLMHSYDWSIPSTCPLSHVHLAAVTLFTSCLLLKTVKRVNN